MTAQYPSLKGARVYVTGGATGIGAAMVRAFAGQGAQVGFLDIATEEGAALAAEAPDRIRFDHVDVTDVAALQAALARAEADWGGIDVLVNNVANDSRHDWRELTPESWDANHAVNLRPMVFAIQSVAPGMIARGRGSILNFGSTAWKARLGNAIAYNAAKAAVHGVTRTMTNELGAAGVRINTVVPGWVLTERQRRLHYDAAGKAWKEQSQPMAGELMPQDLAALALFLGADDSRMCTGQEFTMDGGWV